MNNRRLLGTGIGVSCVYKLNGMETKRSVKVVLIRIKWHAPQTQADKRKVFELSCLNYRAVLGCRSDSLAWHVYVYVYIFWAPFSRHAERHLAISRFLFYFFDSQKTNNIDLAEMSFFFFSMISRTPFLTLFIVTKRFLTVLFTNAEL